MPSDIMVGKMEVLSRFFGEGAAFQVMLGRTNESRVGAAGGVSSGWRRMQSEPISNSYDPSPTPKCVLSLLKFVTSWRLTGLPLLRKVERIQDS